MKSDLYTQITAQIVSELEKGVLPWHKPWNAGHVAGPVSRPLRSTGQPYSGINVIMLWATELGLGVLESWDVDLPKPATWARLVDRVLGSLEAPDRGRAT